MPRLLIGRALKRFQKYISTYEPEVKTKYGKCLNDGFCFVISVTVLNMVLKRPDDGVSHSELLGFELFPSSGILGTGPVIEVSSV
jgi:hypothetical protein